MKQKCKHCNCTSESEYCFRHKPKKPLKTSSSLSRKVEKSEEDNRNISDRNEFFLQIWKKRPHKSEVSGDFLGNEPLTIFFHHILPKEKYPDACFDEENIILLTLDEHTNVESNMYKYETINSRRQLLLSKYQLV
jgi:hypothetical protein